MAKFKSIVTDGGSEALTALIASGQKLILTRAAAGSGVAQVSPNIPGKRLRLCVRT